MVRTRVVIQSRLNSSRLPGKALLTVAGMPLIELVARRAARTGHEVVVATSEEPLDQRIADHLERVGIDCLRGSLNDVLGRFIQATKDMDEDDRIVRLTGDNPVGDATLIDELAEAMQTANSPYGRNDIARMPEGLGCEIFTVADLRRADREATATYDREHVTPWLRRHIPTLDFVPRDNPGDPTRFRCTIDTLSEYDRVLRLFADVEDPIGVPWQHLVAELAEPSFTSGPSVPTRRGSPDRSVITLDADVLSAASAPAPATQLNFLADVVWAGITHIAMSRSANTEPVIRAASEPQLAQRYQPISRLAPMQEDESRPAQSVELSLEHTFAALGRRSVAVAILPTLEDALMGEGGGWERLREYQDEGVVGSVGVRLHRADEIGAALDLPGLGELEVPLELLATDFAGLGEELTGSEVHVTAFQSADEPWDEDTVRLALAQPWVTSISIRCRDARELRYLLDLTREADTAHNDPRSLSAAH